MGALTRGIVYLHAELPAVGDPGKTEQCHSYVFQAVLDAAFSRNANSVTIPLAGACNLKNTINSTEKL